MTRSTSRANAAALLSKAEAEIAYAAAAGDPVDVRQGVVRASFLRALLLGLPLSKAEHRKIAALCPNYRAFVPQAGGAPVSIAAPGLRVTNAVIKGRLDLANCAGADGDALPALALKACRLEGDGKPDAEPGEPGHDVMTCLDISCAHLAQLSLTGSRFSYLAAREAQIDGPLDLSDVAPLASWTPQSWPGVSDPAQREWAKLQSIWVADQATAAAAGAEVGMPAPLRPKAPQGSGAPWPTDAEHHCWASFVGARIDGEVVARGARLRTPAPRDPADIGVGKRRYALNFLGAEIVGGVTCVDNAVFEGGMSLSATHVHGDTWLDGARLIRGEAAAFGGQAATFDGNLSIGGGLQAFGEIWLLSAKIGHTFLAYGAFLDGGGSSALVATSVECGGSVLLAAGFTTRGAVTLSGARVRGELALQDAALDDDGDSDGAFYAVDAIFEGTSRFGPNVTVRGAVNLTGAKMTGAFSFKENVCLEASDADGIALAAGSLEIDDDLVIGDGVVIAGSIYLGSARVSRGVHFTSCKINSRRGWAIDAHDLVAQSMVTFQPGFAARGGINLSGASIGSDLEFNGISVLAGRHHSLCARGLTVQRKLDVSAENVLHGLVDLTDARCATFSDGPASFTETRRLLLDGFKYSRLTRPNVSLPQRYIDIGPSRRDWLARQRPEFHAQPYVALSRVLQAQGEDEAARQILLSKIDVQRATRRRRRRKQRRKERRITGLAVCVFWQAVPWMIDLFRWSFSLMFGYGLMPNRAILTLAAAFVSGWLFFSLANSRGAMVVDQQAVASVASGTGMGASLSDEPVAAAVACGRSIRPSLYALDVFIPLIDLRQESKCEINAAAGHEDTLLPGFSLPRHHLFPEVEIYRFLKAFYALGGWLIISLSILTFTGVLQRRSEET